MNKSTIQCRNVALPDEPDLLTPRVRESLLKQRFESKEADQVTKLIKQDDRVLELGAGLGFISAVAGLAEPDATILSYEANPRLIPYIAAVHQMNHLGNCRVVNAALTSSITALQKKQATFYLRRDFWGSSFSAAPNDWYDTTSVPLHSLNAVIEAFQPTFIVCDIEGAELDVFLNATLSGVTRVLLEIHSKTLTRRGVKTLFDAFSSRDFHYDQHHSSGSVVLVSHVQR